MIRIKIKNGPLELEYEGTEEFFKDEFPSVLEALSKIDIKSVSAESTAQSSQPGNQGTVSNSGESKIQLSTSNIAAKLRCKSGPGLAIAACAHLTLVLNKDTFTRKEILDDMQTATSYYTENHSKNLSNALTSLIKEGKLIERSKDVYALQATQRQQLEATLA